MSQSRELLRFNATSALDGVFAHPILAWLTPDQQAALRALRIFLDRPAADPTLDLLSGFTSNDLPAPRRHVTASAKLEMTPAEVQDRSLQGIEIAQSRAWILGLTPDDLAMLDGWHKMIADDPGTLMTSVIQNANT